MRSPRKSTVARLARDESGAVLVEMALITPLVILLSAGVFEFSNIIHTKLLIEAGVIDAARYIARCSGPNEATCNSRGSNLAANAVVAGGSARVEGWLPADVAVGYLSVAAVAEDGTRIYRSNTTDVRIVQVSTTFAYPGTGLWDFLGFDDLTLTAAHEERVMGW
jgi:Flp pilus assembly protein TadG